MPSPLRYALFDLDNTLYPPDSGLWEAIGARINLYMTERMGLPPAEATAIRRRFLKTFGTTLNGLRLEYAVDPVDYLDYVHDLPLDQYLSPMPALDAMLARLPQVKVIFTNADAAHAQRVLDRLGIRRHFARIIDILALNYVNKPDQQAYQHALELLAAEPAECVFIEDTPHNLLPAHDLGMCTVLVGTPAGAPADHRAEQGIDHHIDTILELENLLAETPGALTPTPLPKEAPKGCCAKG
jgi:putative hydrolase of the HAD superfamily